ncbi:MAG: Xaa-Pro peptidase family protein [Parachlamydiaceae bacterium]
MKIYHSRLKQLQKVLDDALIVSDKTDLFYLTGLDLSAGGLIVHRGGAELCVDGRYIETCRKHSPFPVHLTDTLKMVTELPIKTLAFDSTTTSYQNYEKLQKCGIELVPLDSPLKFQRAIKDKNEISLLKEAGALGSSGFDFLCSLFRERISEKECAVELEIFWKRKGSHSLAFDPIIAFGTNSSMPHYRAGDAMLKRGDTILIDIGVNLNNYNSDMTRMAFYGEPDPRLLEIHSIVQKAQHAALKLCRPGTLIGELDAAARDLIVAHGYGAQFTHSLGHGIGLNVHEYPTIRNVEPYRQIALTPGMAITIEPGIYLPDIGGVRIEDTVVITDKGCENLTNRNTDPFFIEVNR